MNDSDQEVWLQIKTPLLQNKDENVGRMHEGIDQDKKLGTLTQDIIPHILNLYGFTSKAHDFEIYAYNATFEDPSMSAHGVKQSKLCGKVFEGA